MLDGSSSMRSVWYQRKVVNWLFSKFHVYSLINGFLCLLSLLFPRHVTVFISYFLHQCYVCLPSVKPSSKHPGCDPQVCVLVEHWLNGCCLRKECLKTTIFTLLCEQPVAWRYRDGRVANSCSRMKLRSSHAMLMIIMMIQLLMGVKWQDVYE